MEDRSPNGKTKRSPRGHWIEGSRSPIAMGFGDSVSNSGGLFNGPILIEVEKLVKVA